MFYYLLINFSSLLHSFLFKFQLYFDIILVGEIHKLALSRNDIYLDIIEFYQMIWEFVLIWELDIAVEIFLILEPWILLSLSNIILVSR